MVDTRLVVDSIVTSPRLAHENNVIGHDERARRVRGRGQPRPQGRLQVQRPLLRRRAGRPGLLHRGHGPPARRRARRSSATSSTPSAPCASSRRATRTSPSPCCASPTASARRCGRRSASSSACPPCPAILGFDPRFQFIHEDDIAGCLEHAVRHDLEGVYNGAADGVLVLSEVAGLLGKRLAPVLPPVGTVAGRGRPAPRRAAHLARDARPAALRPRPGQPQAQGDRLPLPLHVARGGDQAARAPAPGGHRSATPQEAYRYERELEEFLRRSPSVRPTARRPAARTTVEPGSGPAPRRRPRPGRHRLRRPRRRRAHRSAALAASPRRWPSWPSTSARTPPGPRS